MTQLPQAGERILFVGHYNNILQLGLKHSSS